MVRLDESDKLKIRFNPAKNRDSDTWSAVVLKALSFAPVGYQSILLFRPFDKETQSHDARVLQVLEPTPDNIGKIEEMHPLLEALPSYEVGVKLEYSNKGYRNQIVALNKLMRNPKFEDTAQFILGLDTTSTKEIDIFEGCTDIIHTYLDDAKLDEDQRESIDKFRCVRNNHSLVTGPPGTGKTMVVSTTVICLLGGPKEGYDKKRVLVVAPSNGPVDDAAQRIYDHTQSYKETKDKIIIRCHSLDTEKAYVLASTKNTDGCDSYVDPIDEEGLTTMDQLSVAYSFYKAYEHATERPLGISDRRFKCDKLSLATWILRKAGLVDNHPCADPDTYYEFRSLFEQYQEDELDQETKGSFNKLYMKLRDAVLEEADMVVATIMNTSNTAIYLAFKPDVVIVDECARSSEPEFWYILGNYVAPILLFGDDVQLKLFVKNTSLTNCFVRQIAFSYFSRLKAIGFLWSILKTQHRTVKLIADCTNQIFYQGVLINGSDTIVADRPYALAMQIYLSNKFPEIPKTSAMVIKVHSTAIKNSNYFYYNL